MLHRYLNWKGFKTEVFNAGDYRRIVLLSSDDKNSVVIRESCLRFSIQTIKPPWNCVPSMR